MPIIPPTTQSTAFVASHTSFLGGASPNDLGTDLLALVADYNLKVGFNKLQNLDSAHIIVGNSTNIPANVAMTGDVTISNTGVTKIGDAKVTSRQVKITQAKNATAGDATVTSSTLANVTNASISLTLAVSSNVLLWVTGTYYNTTQNKTIDFRILRAATLIGTLHSYDQSAPPGSTDGNGFAFMEDDLALAAGTYTYQVQLASHDNATSVRGYDVFIRGIVFAA